MHFFVWTCNRHPGYQPSELSSSGQISALGFLAPIGEWHAIRRLFTKLPAQQTFKVCALIQSSPANCEAFLLQKPIFAPILRFFSVPSQSKEEEAIHSQAKEKSLKM